MRGGVIGGRPIRRRHPAFDLAKLARAETHEAAIWQELTHGRRQVSRQTYQEMAAQLPKLRPRVRTP
jgi:hypothetical protein